MDSSFFWGTPCIYYNYNIYYIYNYNYNIYYIYNYNYNIYYIYNYNYIQ
jgi:hypothetical protein